MFVHHTRGLPLDFVIPTNSQCAAVLEAVKDEPSVGADAPILDRFSARRGSVSLWVGARKRAPRSNKETDGRKRIGPLGEEP